MFLLTHAPRILTSLYEAITIMSVLKCHETNQGYLKIWYLYILSTVQFLQVLNASLNLPIYWFFGTSFKPALLKHLISCQPSNSTISLDPPKSAEYQNWSLSEYPSK